MFVRLILALSIVLAASTGAEARKRQVGNIVFEPPKDWILGSIQSEGWPTLLNRRDDERCRFCYIRIHLGTEAKGSFKGWMRRQMKLALDDGRKLKDMQSKTFNQRGLGEVHLHARLVKRNGERIQMFLGFKLKDRFEMIHFEGDVSGNDDAKQTQAALQEEFMPMLNRMAFVSEGAKPVIGKPVAGDLDGVWFGSRVDYGLNFDATMRMDVRSVIFTFYPDGRFYKGVPREGISSFDYAASILSETTETGNYILKDDEVRLFYADGDRDTLDRNGDALKDGNATLTKMRIPEAGFRFEGKLHDFNYMPFAPGISGGVATSSDWRFYRDGSFTGSNFTGGSGDMGSSAFTFSNPGKEQRGRYEISDGVIRLLPKRGAPLVWPFFLQERDGAWRPIVRGEYLRDKDD